MTTLHEAAENIAAMERAYKAVPVPQAPDVRRCVDEMRPLTKPSERVENLALVVGVIALLAGFLN